MSSCEKHRKQACNSFERLRTQVKYQTLSGYRIGTCSRTPLQYWEKLCHLLCSAIRIIEAHGKLFRHCVANHSLLGGTELPP